MKKLLLSVFTLSMFLPALAFASFDTNLSYGMSGPKVSELQEFLIDQGNLVGTSTGNFYSLTLKALKAFQIAQGINPASGYFGPVTRIKASSLISTSTTNSNSSVVPGCASISGYSTINGQECNGKVNQITTTPLSTSTISGCISTSGYSTTNGQACNSTYTPPVITSPTPSTVPGCVSTSGYSIITGQACDGTINQPVVIPSIPSTVPGCASTLGYSTTNGQACNGVVIPQTTVLPAASTVPGCTSISGYSTINGQACNQQQTYTPPQTASPYATPSDVCPNIAGNQTSIPSGMQLTNGNCVAITITPLTSPPTPSCVLTASIESLITPGTTIFGGANVNLSWTFTNMPYSSTTPGTLRAFGIQNGVLIDTGNMGHLIQLSPGETTTRFGFEPIYKVNFSNAVASVTCYAFFPDYWTNSSTLPNVGDVSTSEAGVYQQYGF